MKIHLNRQLCLNLLLQILGTFQPSKGVSLVQSSLYIPRSQFCREMRIILLLGESAEQNIIV